MKHVITFEEEDLLQFVRDMLAMRGVAPAGEIKIEELHDGEQKEGTVPKHYINVVCKDVIALTHCPLCKHSLTETKEAEKPLTLTLAHREEPEEEPEESEEPAESVILDESLGESLEPPEPLTHTSKRGDGGGPSIASLRAQSDRVRREREPTLPRRPKGTKA